MVHVEKAQPTTQAENRVVIRNAGKGKVNVLSECEKQFYATATAVVALMVVVRNRAFNSYHPVAAPVTSERFGGGRMQLPAHHTSPLFFVLRLLP